MLADADLLMSEAMEGVAKPEPRQRKTAFTIKSGTDCI
jgi:hypothetical protein